MGSNFNSIWNIEDLQILRHIGRSKYEYDIFMILNHYITVTFELSCKFIITIYFLTWRYEGWWSSKYHRRPIEINNQHNIRDKRL